MVRDMMGHDAVLRDAIERVVALDNALTTLHRVTFHRVTLDRVTPHLITNLGI